VSSDILVGGSELGYFQKKRKEEKREKAQTIPEKNKKLFQPAPGFP
jgi:hypothetical protein